MPTPHSPQDNPFSVALRRIAARAAAPERGLSVRQLEAVSGLGRSTINDWLTGRSLPRNWHDGAAPVVEAVIRLAEQYGNAFADADEVRAHCRAAYGRAKGEGCPAPRTPGDEPAVPRSVVAPPVGRLPVVHGRDELLDGLGELAFAGPGEAVVVLAGMGGVGKSTVALELSRRATEHGLRVWWVDAATQSALHSGMISVAAELGASEREQRGAAASAAAALELVWGQLHAAPRKWLLILDNADDPAVLAPAGDLTGGTGWVRPSGAGVTVVTSRIIDWARWGNHAHLRILDPLPAAAGATLLLDRMGLPGGGAERAPAEDLSRELGGLPLALHLAGSYLGSGLATFDLPGLARRVSADGGLNVLSLGATRHGGSVRSDITRTWGLSLHTLADQGVPQARGILEVLAQYAPNNPIRTAWLNPRVLAEHKLITGPPETALFAGLDGLAAFGLIMIDGADAGGDSAILLHPLVAEAARADTQDKRRAQRAAAALLEAVTAAYPERDWHAWPTWLAITPHLRQLLRTSSYAITEICALANRMVDELSVANTADTAEDLIDAVLAQRSTLGEDHPELLSARANRGYLLWRGGRVREAERLFAELAAARRRVLGPEHPDTLVALSDQGLMALDCGRPEESARLLGEVLAVMERVREPEHPSTLITKHNLASAHRWSGSLEEACRLEREVLETRRRTDGLEHIDTLQSQLALGQLLALAGETDEAETLATEALAAVERNLGEGHAVLLNSRAKCGSILLRCGRTEPALDHLETAFAGLVKSLGPERPHTLFARQWLGAALAAAERPDEGRRHLDAALLARETALGPDHFHTREIRSLLSGLPGPAG
ncbi:tetratricopeptide repeat protein [Streptomyces sp. NEAU-174]|uniref:tetratricopeptide repeat protein n=1 Tax=Streptomyces sp. NEAU-174 TaxID=3458254 RepID=UPI0040443960